MQQIWKLVEVEKEVYVYDSIKQQQDQLVVFIACVKQGRAASCAGANPWTERYPALVTD